MSSPRTSSNHPLRGARRSSTRSGDEPGFLSLPPDHARVLLFVAFRPAAFALAVVVVTMLVTLLTAGSDLTGLSGAVAAGWLAVHQVPLLIGSTTVGLLPVLPTALLLWAAAREAVAATDTEPTRAELGWLCGAAMGGPLLITAVCLAVTEDASGSIALQRPNPLTAFGWVLLLHLTAVLCGIAFRCRERLFEGLPYDVIAAAYVAARAVSRLLAAAAVLLVLGLLLHWSRVGETYGAAEGIVDVLGLTLLSLLYLPNAAVAAVGVLVGPGVEFGAASVGVFTVVGGPIPAVPVLAAVPAGPAVLWWAVLLLVPAAVGVYGGVESARVSYDRPGAPWALLAAAGLGSAALTALAALSGGELGNFGRLGLELPVFALAVFAWLAIPGYAGLLFARTFVVSFPTPLMRHPDALFDPDDIDYDEDYYPDEQESARGPADRALPERRLPELPADSATDPRARYAGLLDRPPAESPGPEQPLEVEAEVVEDQPRGSTAEAVAAAEAAPEIVDAEVVEPDALDGDDGDGRRS
ncbi:cell division protein PerM [Nocardia grenadensis]|uniref:cell division protein PerM n=1 Tax=Nocardia grenadensis TaxID=931537 RepID=UPI003D71938E